MKRLLATSAILGSLVPAGAMAQEITNLVVWRPDNQSASSQVSQQIASLIVRSNPDPTVQAVGSSPMGATGTDMTVNDVLAALGGTGAAIGTAAPSGAVVPAAATTSEPSPPSPPASTTTPAATTEPPSRPATQLPSWYTGSGSEDSDSGGGGGSDGGGGGGGWGG